MTFLKAHGIRGLVGKNDWPRYTEEEPEIYEQEELDKLFAKCDAEERLWYEFFLMTGSVSRKSCTRTGPTLTSLRARFGSAINRTEDGHRRPIRNARFLFRRS